MNAKAPQNQAARRWHRVACGRCWHRGAATGGRGVTRSEHVTTFLAEFERSFCWPGKGYTGRAAAARGDMGRTGGRKPS